MQHLEVSGAVRHIYVVQQLRVNRSSEYSSNASCQMKYRYASLNDGDTF